MSEVEKLRALLAEARGALSQGCWNGRCCAVRARIDAALAGPVEDMEKAWHHSWRQERESNAELVRERDEARAEVERLRQIVSACASAIGNGSFASPECSLEFMSGIPAEIASEAKRGRGAYQRGAAAMREAVWLAVFSAINEARGVITAEISALPVPEDKP